jgi:hypothetical protein
MIFNFQLEKTFCFNGNDIFVLLTPVKNLFLITGTNYEHLL